MQTSPKILSTHRVAHFRVDFFLTRFGNRVWFVIGFGTAGHEVEIQGTRGEAIAFLRGAL